MSDEPICGYCGKPAEGFAAVNDVRYCHEDESPTCYERAQRPARALLPPDVRAHLLATMYEALIELDAIEEMQP